MLAYICSLNPASAPSIMHAWPDPLRSLSFWQHLIWYLSLSCCHHSFNSSFHGFCNCWSYSKFCLVLSWLFLLLCCSDFGWVDAWAAGASVLSPVVFKWEVVTAFLLSWNWSSAKKKWAFLLWWIVLLVHSLSILPLFLLPLLFLSCLSSLYNSVYWNLNWGVLWAPSISSWAQSSYK